MFSQCNSGEDGFSAPRETRSFWSWGAVLGQATQPGSVVTLWGEPSAVCGVKIKVMATKTDAFYPNLGKMHKENVTGEKETGM